MMEDCFTAMARGSWHIAWSVWFSYPGLALILFIHFALNFYCYFSHNCLKSSWLLTNKTMRKLSPQPSRAFFFWTTNPFTSPLLLPSLPCSLQPPSLSLLPPVSSGLPCRSRSPLFCFSDFCNSVHSPLPE